MNILILSCGTRCLLVDYFMDRNNGFDRVIVTDCSANSPALYRADKYYIVPRMTDNEYIPMIDRICERESVSAILPLQEDELVLISSLKDHFKKNSILPLISDIDLINTFRDKYLCYEELRKRGIPAIPTFKPDNIEELLREFDLPYFMKPKDGAGSVSNYVVNNRSSIDSIVEENSEEFIIQPFIQGTEYGVNAYVDFITGKPAAVFILKKIRMRSGETEKSVSLHNEQIRSIVEKICCSFSFAGAIDIDIMEKDGDFHVLEINPRFGGGYPHAYECGVNFIKMIANNIRGIANQPGDTDYEDDIFAFRFMSISILRKEDMPDEK